MLRDLCVATVAAFTMSAGAIHADDLSKAGAAPMGAASSSVPATQSKRLEDLYLLCAFYPKQGTCEPVYQHALKDNSIAAEAVRAEYAGYARYLNGSAPLTDADREYLNKTGIRVPNDLSAANQTGLHNVINDAALSADARRAAVNNFLSRAVEAELYCGFNSCQDSASHTATAGVWPVRGAASNKSHVG